MLGGFHPRARPLDRRIARARPKVVAAAGTQGDPAHAVDGVRPCEGSAADPATAIGLMGPQAHLTLALPRVKGASLLVMAAGRETYDLACSADGRAYTPRGQVPIHALGGLRTRVLPPATIAGCRFLRIRPAADGLHILAEIALVRGAPAPCPPAPAPCPWRWDARVCAAAAPAAE